MNIYIAIAALVIGAFVAILERKQGLFSAVTLGIATAFLVVAVLSLIF